MNDRKIIQHYINSFRIYISLDLRPGVGLSCNIYPVRGPGAILEFSLGEGTPNSETYLSDFTSVNEALKAIKQTSIGGQLDGLNFGGTNILMEENRIILIKGDDEVGTWDSEAARHDVIRAVSSKPEKAK